MAATLTDLCRRGEQGDALAAVFAQVEVLLAAWVAAAASRCS